MKLTNKQKHSLLKLNEDFFDDFEDNELVDDTFNELIGDPDYTYHFQFIIYMFPFIKDTNRNECVYYFENPEYKPIIGSTFISIKKALDCILLLSSRIVTNYSKPKFCTLSDKFISIFPFMNNKPEYRLFLDEEREDIIYKEIFNKSISLEMSLNLSDKKNRDTIEKLLHSFYKLKLMYNNLIKKFNPELISAPPVEFGYFRNNPFVRSILLELITPTDEYPSHDVDILLTNPEELKNLHSDDKEDFN